MSLFWVKNCEIDSRGVLGQEKAEGPLIKAPEDAELASERLLGDRCCSSRVGPDGQQVYPGPKTRVLHWCHQGHQRG